jgi:hypothetical protein
MKKLRYILPREDLEIDTCLRVFGTEFQVHSEVLKRRSAFFKKFFDSADRDDHDNTRGSFKYSFKTQMDEFQWDGDEPCWRLIPESAPEVSRKETFLRHQAALE